MKTLLLFAVSCDVFASMYLVTSLPATALDCYKIYAKDWADVLVSGYQISLNE